MLSIRLGDPGSLTLTPLVLPSLLQQSKYSSLTYTVWLSYFLAKFEDERTAS